MGQFDLRNFLTENKLTEQSKMLNERIQQRYRKGDTVELTDDALDNYGKKYKGKKFKIVSVSKSDRDHPGFDSSSNSALYDLDNLDFSVYDWELK